VTTISKQKQVLSLISISMALVAAIFVAYEPVRHNDFVNYDDGTYVTKNPNVNSGITHDSVIWAFTKSHASNWHPLTWLSHMLDCEIYGLNPLGHHITNVLIHIANSLLLFYVLRRMTGAVWRSAFVAAAFALHPIHVESVAWVTERKDVLSGLFWMLTILAYVRYVERPNIGRYLLVPAAFVMGLMSKPMVVTLPFVLLLLDYWPLERLNWGRPPAEKTVPLGRLLVEKVPLLLLSAISSVITFVVQTSGGAVQSLKAWPLQIRIINSLGNYLNYVVKMLYPKGLAIWYAPPEKMTIDTAAIAVIGAAVLLVLWGRGRRWLVVGLLWYLGVLVPVIGLVQVGYLFMADRYTYLPSIGVFIIVAWGAAEIFAKLSLPKPLAAGAIAAAVVAMVVMTRIQVSYWWDGPTLYERSLAVSGRNTIIHYIPGMNLYKEGSPDKEPRHVEEAIRINPAWQKNRLALLKLKKFDLVISWLNKAFQKESVWPDMHEMYDDLGMAYECKGDLILAEQNYRMALSIKPDYETARNNLASVLTKQGKMPAPAKTDAGNP
jgi:protein O-mannosyl-transferase